MKQKFINQYQIPFDMFKEWANNPIGKSAIRSRKKSIRIRTVGIIVSIIMIFFGVIINEYYAILMGATLFVVFMLRLFIIPNKILKKQYNMILKVHNNDTWTRTITLSDNIVIDNEKSSSYYEYSEVFKITEDTKWFYLFLNEDIVLRIHKDSFISGSSESFREFIDSAVSNKTHNS